MERKIYGVFVAGGHGTRMGTEIPKQFLDLNGRPVLQHTIKAFLETITDLQIVVVLPKEHIETWKSICRRTGFDYSQILVEGGITRFHSVKAALARIPDGATVMIHDGVRPLTSPRLIQALLSQSESNPAVIPVCPVTDTLKCLDPNLRPLGTGEADRSCLYGAQTPQVFHSEVIKQAYLQGYETSFTDDASVAARMQIPLTYVLGERYNIKITTQEDLIVAQALLV